MAVAAAACLALCACGGGSGGTEAVTTAGLPGSAPSAQDPQTLALLAQLELQPAPAPAQVRQTSATEFAVDGNAYTAWSGAPTISPSPDGPTWLRLRCDADHLLAYAAYSLPAQRQDYNGLPRRINIDITPAPETPGAEPQPLEYYVAVSNYTDTRWTWQGPFTSAYSLLINSAGQRDRSFDLHGNTLVAIAMAGAPGTPRAADLARIRYTTAGTFYPVRPYRPQITAANLVSAVDPLPGQPDVQAAHADFKLDKGSVNPDPDPFQTYGFDSIDVYRRPAGGGEWTLIGNAHEDEALGGGALFADPFDEATGVSHPLPGGSYEYQVRLRNAQGVTALSPTLEASFELLAPVFTQVLPDDQTIQLSWGTQADIDHYDLYRNNALLDSLPPDVGTYADSAADPGVAYAYRLRAVSGPLHQDSTDASGVRWPYPAYQLSGAAGTGQLLDLSGHLAVVATASSGATCQFDLKEATATPPGPNDWTVLTESMAGQDPHATSFPWEGISSTSFACVLYGQPVVALDSDLSSTQHFDFALAYRQPPAPGPNQPDPWTLPWTELYVTAPALVDNYSLATVGNAPALAWIDEGHTGVGYSAALSATPQSSSDWKTSRATTTTATAVWVTDVGGLPALLVNEFNGLYYYRCDSTQPFSTNEWTKMQLDTEGAGCSLTTVSGTPFALYTRNGDLRFARSPFINPSQPSDWVTGDLAAGPVSLARAANCNGVPAVAYVAHDGNPDTHDGTLYLAQAQTPSPASSADWTFTPLDATGDSDAPGIAFSANVLYVCYDVYDSGLRPGGMYLMSIPTT
jgi:hypothetical protein